MPEPRSPEPLETLATAGEQPELGRWRRLRGMVNARVFGDELPRVGRYRLQYALGSGAMGVVFSALDTELQREVAIKLLTGRADPEQRRRLQREAQAIARVSHPNVVGVYDVGEHDGEMFVAMELVVGRTLRAWIEEGPHPWRETARLFASAARGLAAAHAAGLVHRDFKPENVLVGEGAEQGESRRVCVVDFGLVTRGAEASDALADDLRVAASDDVAASIPLAGTPAYMAPEQILGRPVDARADVWSFCVALFEALHGRRPFDRDNVVATLGAAARGEIAWPRRRRGVPRRLDRLLRRALQVDRDRRTLDCTAIARELDAAAGFSRRMLVVAGAGALAASFAGVAVRAFGPADDACTSAEAALVRDWNADRRAQIEARLVEQHVSEAAVVGEAIDDYALRWREQLAATCDGEAEDAQALATRGCLQGQREALGAVATLLAEADLAIALNHGQLVAGLADPQLCGDARTRPELVLDDGAFAEQRTELARARALWNAGDDRHADEIARAMFEGAQRDEAWSIVADAGILVGEIASLRLDDLTPVVPTMVAAREAAARVGWRAAVARADALLVQDPRDAGATAIQRRFAAAQAEAEAAQDPEAVALLAVAVAQLGGAVFGLDADASREQAARAEALGRERLGAGHRLLQELVRGTMQRRSPDLVLARAHLADAIRNWGPNGNVTANARLVVGAVLAHERRYDEALAEFTAGADVLRELQGDDSPSYVSVLDAIFETQAEAGRIDAAIATAERAMSELADAPVNPRVFGWDAAWFADAAAELLLATGDPKRALRFAEQSAREREHVLRVPHAITLAEALWRNGDPARAVRVADEAWQALLDPEPELAPVSTFRAQVGLVRGEARLRLGELDDALADFRGAVPDLLSTVPRDHVRVHVGLAMVASRRGDRATLAAELALAHAKVDELRPTDPLRAELDALR